MPRTSGRMRTDHERKIKKNITFFKENVDAKDLVDVFIEEDIFDFPDQEKINGYNPNTSESRNNCFLQLLVNSGPKAYDVFIDALNRTGFDFVARKIQETQVNDGQTPNDAELGPEWINTVPLNIRQKLLDERDLSRIAQAFGNDWELVAFEMGLKKQDVDQSKMEQHTPTMQIYSCFNKWRTRAVGQATLQNFVRIVGQCPSTVVDWQQVKRMMTQ